MNSTTKQAETPIFFEVLAVHKTTEERLREETKGLDLESWFKAVEKRRVAPMWQGDQEYLQAQYDKSWTPERYGGTKG